MCLDYIIAHETCYFYLALPLKLACFTKQHGTFGTQEFKCIFVCIFFGLPIEMFNKWRLVIHRWKGVENTFSMGYYTPQKN